MTYIPPNGQVEYFSDLGISKQDTLYFATAAEKNTYFSGLAKVASESEMMYTSRQKGIIRSSLSMAVAGRIGFLRYRNQSFENFWFYAWVTDVEYANNGMVEIHFEIDSMTTYMGTFQLNECYVERQHTVGDEIGDNICDERLEYGDYKYRAVTQSGYTSSDNDNGINGNVVLITTAKDDDAALQLPDVYGSVYSGCDIHVAVTPSGAKAFLKNLADAGKTDTIVSIQQFPSDFVDTVSANYPIVHKETVIEKPYTDIDGYVPKNNKLFIYPYNYLTVTNMEGNFADFRYEFFSGNSAYFTIEGGVTNTPELVLSPVFYKGANKNYSEKLTMKNFPTCAWNNDMYKAYLAQNNSNIAVEALSSLSSGNLRSVSMAAQIASLLPIPIVSSGLSAIASQAAEMYSYAQKPTQSGGSQGGDTMTALKQHDFQFIQKTITRNYAEMIDNFFDMFGYAVKQHLIPNMNARPGWTYCKTIDCVVHGALPSSDAREIESRFNSGVRFWKSVDTIGDYSINNKPYTA